MDLILVGIVVGFISGFFGVGGGMVLVPVLLYLGFEMKEAIAISVMQMVFSSTYGTFLNIKKYKNLLKDGLIIGAGGFIGGLQSGYILTHIDSYILQNLFIVIVMFAIYKVYTAKMINIQETNSHNKIVLFGIGSLIGIIAMSIGVGGAVMLTPILVGYLSYNIKSATSLGLFFVVFSSIAGFISLSFNNMMPYEQGAIIGLASMFGVYYGIKIKDRVNLHSYKKYIITLYSLILGSMIYKII